jgi:hypothetical protein
MLTDSLGGNSKTCIYACIGPSASNYDETYSTLHFATRAMNIKTHATLNENVDFKPITNEGVVMRNHFLENQTTEMRQEIDELKIRLATNSRTPTVLSNSTIPRTPPETTGGYSPLSTSEVMEDDVSKYLRII